MSLLPEPMPTTELAEIAELQDEANAYVRASRADNTIRAYRDRVRQCEALGEFALAEQIRQILIDEQDHQIDLATALGEDVPDLTKPKSK